MAQTVQRVRNTVKLKKGEHVILPADAQIISITEVDGGQAESLCDLPEPTPLASYTFYFDRAADGDGFHYVGIQQFHLGGNSITFNDPFVHQDYNYNNVQYNYFLQALKNFPGVAALYYCPTASASPGEWNNTITMEVPESLAAPYFIAFTDTTDTDYWLFRIDPVDTSNPIQVERQPCTTRV